MFLAFKDLYVGHIRRMRASIRAERKDRLRPRPGEVLLMYAGVRTSFIRKLGTAICEAVQDVVINTNGFFIDGEPLNADERDAIAALVGFDSFEKCWKYWLRHQRLPFRGWIVFWKDFE